MGVQRNKRRFRIMSLSTLIPNLITVMALCSGLTGVRFAFQERWEFAVAAIVMAAIFDALDGRLARLLKGLSRFGAELDSLSDFISFGVAPALILFLWTTQEVRGFGWMSSLFFATCMALRLARFNTHLDDFDPRFFANRFFSGVPAPAAAGLACLPLILSFEFGSTFVSNPHLVATWMSIIGLMMVSSVPTFSFKATKLPQKLILPVLLVAGLFIAAILSEPWLSLGSLIIIYLLTIPISFRSYRRLINLYELSDRDQEKQNPKENHKQ